MPSNGPAPIDTTYLPRLMLPGATAAEVKSLALGAARSRGWTVRVADSTADRLVVERPADASVLGSMPGSMLEVTTLLKDVGGGIEVASLAEVVTPPQGGRPAARLDYTDQFRDPLMQSLESLRDRWVRDRERLARAAPPPEGWKSAWDDPSNPIAPAASRASMTQAAPAPMASAPTPPAAPATPRTGTGSAPRITTQPQTPARTTTQAPARTESSVPKPTYTRKPASEPRQGTPRAAPVVDASSRPKTPATRAAAPAPTRPTPAAAPQDNMVSLPRAESRPKTTSGARVKWSAKAEQYARQRGCKVAGSGSQLIESRQDGEVYKVPCQGSDSFLIRCQSGTCQGLL